MAKEEELQDKLMPIAGLKSLLKHAKDEPQSCAFGLTKDKTAVLLLDKLMKPKKVRDALKKDAGDAVVPNTIRFGTVSIKPEDTSTLNFTVNKPEVGGTITAMVKLAKKMSYAGVVINADEGLDKEDEEQPQASTIPPPPPAPGSGQPPIDWGGIRKRADALMERMHKLLGQDPGRQDQLTGLAQAMNQAFGAQNLPATEQAMKAFEEALNAAPPPPPPPPPPSGDNPLMKSAQIWTATTRKVKGDLDRLRGAIINAYPDDGLAKQLGDAFDARVAELRKQLDEPILMQLLNAATKEQNEQKRAAGIEGAKKVIAKHAAFFEGQGIIGDLDANPFLPLTIKTTMSTTLAAMEKTVH